MVALLAEGVGRNVTPEGRLDTELLVALLAEGVGRNNFYGSTPTRQEAVALLAEGVGRNHPVRARSIKSDRSPSSRRAWVEIGAASRPQQATPSPSSRRAWVEIRTALPQTSTTSVALLAEGVGRNIDDCGVDDIRSESPSSRRAWVEIGRHGSGSGYPQSPSSRRAWVEIQCRLPPPVAAHRRPPRGGRG